MQSSESPEYISDLEPDIEPEYIECIQESLFGSITKEPAKVSSWAFTIKILSNTKPPEYDRILARWTRTKNVVIDCFETELDSHGKSHIHGIVLLPKHMYKKRLFTCGYHTYLKEVYNRDAWTQYIKKSQPI